MFDPKDMVKFFIAKNGPSIAPDSDQVIVAFKEGDLIGTQLDPSKLIGKKIIGFEYVETNVGKTLFLKVE